MKDSTENEVLKMIKIISDSTCDLSQEVLERYDIEEGKVVQSEVVDTNGSGHGALAGVLNALNADVLICGGIGGGAQTALAAAGIKLF